MIERKTVSQCVSEDYCKGWNDAVDNMPKWISVKERMPDFFDTLLIIDDRKVAFPAHYAEKSGLKGFYSVDGYFYTYITHWMPLPEPPKEDAHEIT